MSPAATDTVAAAQNGHPQSHGQLRHSVPPTVGKERKEDSTFKLQSDWSSVLPCNDQVYGHNSLGCPEEEWRARVDLAAVYRLCHKHGLNEGINNHLTAMVPGQQDRFLVFPFGLMWSEVTASNLLVVSSQGKVISGRGEPETTAFFIHSPIHQHHPEGMCILHTHQTEVTAFTCLEDPLLPMVGQNNIRFYKDMAVHADYDALCTCEEEGTRMADLMGPRHVLLMQNHGVLVAHKTIAQAWNALYYLERAAASTLKAMATGQKLKIVPDSVCEDWIKTYGRVEPEYSRLLLEASKRELLLGPDKDFIK